MWSLCAKQEFAGGTRNREIYCVHSVGCILWKYIWKLENIFGIYNRPIGLNKSHLCIIQSSGLSYDPQVGNHFSCDFNPSRLLIYLPESYASNPILLRWMEFRWYCINMHWSITLSLQIANISPHPALPNIQWSWKTWKATFTEEPVFGLCVLGYCRIMVVQHGRLHRGGPVSSVDINSSF